MGGLGGVGASGEILGRKDDIVGFLSLQSLFFSSLYIAMPPAHLLIFLSPLFKSITEHNGA